jgi:predicted GNAT family acetyltransferase
MRRVRRAGPDEAESVTMHDDAERQRFEIDVDGAVVFAEYRRRDGLVAITHVEAPIELRGKGHADRLMREVADAARAQVWRIRPLCGYAVAWMRRHRDYADVVG